MQKSIVSIVFLPIGLWLELTFIEADISVYYLYQRLSADPLATSWNRDWLQ